MRPSAHFSLGGERGERLQRMVKTVRNEFRSGCSKCTGEKLPALPRGLITSPATASHRRAAAEMTGPEFPHQTAALSPQLSERAEGLAAARWSDLNVKRNAVNPTVWK